MTHTPVFGMGQHGKTWLMKRRAAKLLSVGQPCIVYAGNGDTSWPEGCTFLTHASQLEQVLDDRNSFGSHLFLDEVTALWRQASPRWRYPLCHELPIQGRHRGFSTMWATVNPMGVPIDVRANATESYCFRLGTVRHAKAVVEMAGLDDDWVQRLRSLPPLQFYILTPTAEPKLCRLA